jgi:predicted nuclease of predicted toxin-antitoxin system
MAEPKFYFNENVPLRLSELLRRLGIIAICTQEVGNKGTTDEFQLQYSVSNGYIMVTHNRQYFKKLHKLWIQEGKSHYGILVVHVGELEDLTTRIKLFVKKRYSFLKAPFCESPPKL